MKLNPETLTMDTVRELIDENVAGLYPARIQAEIQALMREQARLEAKILECSAELEEVR